jgi:hypothetical protein
MKVIFRFSLLAAFIFAGGAGGAGGRAAYGADTLQLRGGRTVTGTFVAATRTEVWFQCESKTSITETSVFPLGQVASLVFDPNGSPLGASRDLRPAVRPALAAQQSTDSIRNWIGSRIGMLGLRYGAILFPPLALPVPLDFLRSAKE